MWTIRWDQVEAFRNAALQKFEDDMVEHLKQFAPRQWQGIGDSAGRQEIKLGITQASQYGFTNRGSVRFYIELMFMLGSYFDVDPQYHWAQTVLMQPSDIDQMVRADTLYDVFNDYWEAVAGPDNTYLLRALHKLSRANPE